MKLLVFLFLSVLVIKCMDPPLLPQKFTSVFMLHLDDESVPDIPGQYWFDFDSKSDRLDVQNILVFCQGLYTNQTDCTWLTVNKTLYQILPKQNLCCYEELEDEITRNLFENFTYVKNMTLDQTSYYFFYQDGGFMVPPFAYYTMKNTKFVPRRYSMEDIQNQDDYVGLDFWTNTQNQKFNSASIFKVPTYCKKACNQIIPSRKQTKISKKVYQLIQSVALNIPPSKCSYDFPAEIIKVFLSDRKISFHTSRYQEGKMQRHNFFAFDGQQVLRFFRQYFTSQSRKRYQSQNAQIFIELILIQLQFLYFGARFEN